MSDHSGSERLAWVESLVDEISARLNFQRPAVVVADRKLIGTSRSTRVWRTDLTGKSSDLPELTIPPDDLNGLPEDELRFAIAAWCRKVYR
jgi:hypothetical protein